jgi:hypothetical protein
MSSWGIAFIALLLPVIWISVLWGVLYRRTDDVGYYYMVDIAVFIQCMLALLGLIMGYYTKYVRHLEQLRRRPEDGDDISGKIA